MCEVIVISLITQPYSEEPGLANDLLANEGSSMLILQSEPSRAGVISGITLQYCVCVCGVCGVCVCGVCEVIVLCIRVRMSDP